MSNAAVANSFDVLGDAQEYQEWLLQQSTPEQADEEEAQPLAMSVADLPADIAQVVQGLQQEDVAVVLATYQKLQQAR